MAADKALAANKALVADKALAADKANKMLGILKKTFKFWTIRSLKILQSTLDKVNLLGTKILSSH